MHVARWICDFSRFQISQLIVFFLSEKSRKPIENSFWWIGKSSNLEKNGWKFVIVSFCEAGRSSVTDFSINFHSWINFHRTTAQIPTEVNLFNVPKNACRFPLQRPIFFLVEITRLVTFLWEREKSRGKLCSQPYSILALFPFNFDGWVNKCLLLFLLIDFCRSHKIFRLNLINSISYIRWGPHRE